MILACDTATAATVVGVGSLDGRLLAARRHDPAPGERPGHGARLLTLAGEALTEAGCEWADLTRLGAGAGPGGFTGLRIGLATGRGIALSVAVETVPLGSLDALAAASRPADEPFVAILDARRGEVFAAVYEAGGASRGAPCAVPPDELAAAFGLAPCWRAAGDGAIRYRDALTAQGAAIAPDDDPGHPIDAAALVALTAAGTPAPLDPVYVRAPDAVPRT